MKFSTTAGDLHRALSVATTVLPRNPVLAVFSCVHLAISGNQLEVTASAEQETTVTASITVHDVEPGNVVLVPAHLTKYLHTLPGSTPVTATSDGKTQLVVETGAGAPYTFRAMDATFPATSLGKADRRPTDLSRLPAALAGVTACARETKVVQLVSDATGLRLHATDGKRLARAYLPEGGFGDFSGLLPLDALKPIAESAPTAVEVDRRGRAITFAAANVRVTTRLIDEVYPSVDAMLDNVPHHTALIPLAALREKLARIESVAFAKRPLSVSVHGDELTLAMESVDVGSGVETVELVHPASSEVTFAINLDYLSAAVSALAGEENATLAWASPEAAVFLLATGTLPVTVVIMPVRLG